MKTEIYCHNNDKKLIKLAGQILKVYQIKILIRICTSLRQESIYFYPQICADSNRKSIERANGIIKYTTLIKINQTGTCKNRANYILTK